MKVKMMTIAIALFLWSCGDDKAEVKDEKGKDAKKEVHEGHDHEHDHGHEHGHDDHGHHDHGHEHNGPVWEEEEAFHELMADIWHSAADDANYSPLLSKARDLADAAEKWSSSEIPEAYQSKGVEESLDMLKIQSAELADMVDEGAEEEALHAKLDAVHTLFHGIIDGGDHGHDHDHEGHNHEGHDHDHEH